MAVLSVARGWRAAGAERCAMLVRALHDVRAVCTSTLQARCARSPRTARRVQRVARGTRRTRTQGVQQTR